jgi:hypothetical protein
MNLLKRFFEVSLNPKPAQEVLFCALCGVAFQDQLDPISHEAGYLISYPPPLANSTCIQTRRELVHRTCMKKK